MAKRFSLKNKLILIFGVLIALAAIVQGFFAVNIARKAVTEKVEAHLIDKAEDTAELIDGRINSFFQFYGRDCKNAAVKERRDRNRGKTLTS